MSLAALTVTGKEHHSDEGEYDTCLLRLEMRGLHRSGAFGGVVQPVPPGEWSA
jgi:hypothetical protein